MVSAATLNNMLSKFQFIGFQKKAKVIRGWSSGMRIQQEESIASTEPEIPLEIPPRIMILAGILEEPSGYGRIVTNEEGQFLTIIEEKDATPEQCENKQINAGVYIIHSEFLNNEIQNIHNNNIIKEFYLHTMFSSIVAKGKADCIQLCHIPRNKCVEIMGINTHQQLIDIECIVSGVKLEHPKPVPAIEHRTPVVPSKRPSINPNRKTGLFTMRDIESYREEYPEVKPNPPGEKKTGIHRLYQ
jgi:hypothetical protein